jgi:hypothetical protein
VSESSADAALPQDVVLAAMQCCAAGGERTVDLTQGGFWCWLTSGSR